MPRLQRRSHQESYPRQGCRESDRGGRLNRGTVTNRRGPPRIRPSPAREDGTPPFETPGEGY